MTINHCARACFVNKFQYIISHSIHRRLVLRWYGMVQHQLHNNPIAELVHLSTVCATLQLDVTCTSEPLFSEATQRGARATTSILLTHRMRKLREELNYRKRIYKAWWFSRNSFEWITEYNPGSDKIQTIFVCSFVQGKNEVTRTNIVV